MWMMCSTHCALIIFFREPFGEMFASTSPVSEKWCQALRPSAVGTTRNCVWSHHNEIRLVIAWTSVVIINWTDGSLCLPVFYIYTYLCVRYTYMYVHTESYRGPSPSLKLMGWVGVVCSWRLSSMATAASQKSAKSRRWVWGWGGRRGLMVNIVNSCSLGWSELEGQGSFETTLTSKHLDQSVKLHAPMLSWFHAIFCFLFLVALGIREDSPIVYLTHSTKMGVNHQPSTNIVPETTATN